MTVFFHYFSCYKSRLSYTYESQVAMNNEERGQIFANCDALLSAVNWPNIFPKLLERGVYLRDDSNVQRWQVRKQKTHEDRDSNVITGKREKKKRNNCRATALFQQCSIVDVFCVSFTYRQI